ncbi:MAG: hypothetical protein M1834_008030 [Cirrosporium novae-zelandiae]|nr:MAG: hypothetical protein M1834_008030 [Cirrosporium novae-zelandiae]
MPHHRGENEDDYAGMPDWEADIMRSMRGGMLGDEIWARRERLFSRPSRRDEPASVPVEVLEKEDDSAGAGASQDPNYGALIPYTRHPQADDGNESDDDITIDLREPSRRRRRHHQHHQHHRRHHRRDYAEQTFTPHEYADEYGSPSSSSYANDAYGYGDSAWGSHTYSRSGRRHRSGHNTRSYENVYGYGCAPERRVHRRRPRRHVQRHGHGGGSGGSYTYGYGASSSSSCRPNRHREVVDLSRNAGHRYRGMANSSSSSYWPGGYAASFFTYASYPVVSYGGGGGGYGGYYGGALHGEYRGYQGGGGGGYDGGYGGYGGGYRDYRAYHQGYGGYGF